MVNGTSCLKVVGVQQSDDWDRPRVDRTAWRRQDTVWLIARLGYASRVERVIELREPARREPSQHSVLRYDLESSLSYPGPLYESRRQEISQAQAFAESAAPLLPAPQRYGQQINYLLTRISNHVENQAPTPYREAVLQVRRRVEAARHGDTPPVVAPEAPEERPVVATPGYPAPDFVTTQFTDTQSVRLRHLQGKPVLLLFYNPTALTAEPVLTYAQHMSQAHAGRLTVLPLSILDDAQPALRQRAALGVTLPILSGNGLRISYDVETTPKMILLDGQGILRGSYLGWGRETPAEIAEELKNWLPAQRDANRAPPIAPIPPAQRIQPGISTETGTVLPVRGPLPNAPRMP
jgi:peroxiredoxin